MLKFPFWISAMLLVCCLAACNLAEAPKQLTAIPTLEVTLATRTPVVTRTPITVFTPLPSWTPAPTTTPIPLPTMPLPTATPVYQVLRPGPGPVCSLMPSGSIAEANIRSAPGTRNLIVGGLPANNYVTAILIDADGWYQISSPGTPVDGDWMSSTVVDLQQPCVCGPNTCVAANVTLPTFTPLPLPTATFPPDQCVLTLIDPNSLVPDYGQPTLDQKSTGNLDPTQHYEVVGRTDNGWYGLLPEQVQPDTVGIYQLVWVVNSSPIELSGIPCGQLKTIDLSYPNAAGCMVSPANGANVSVYPEYDLKAAPIGHLNADASVSVVGQSAPGVDTVKNGWYAVEPAIAQAGSVGKYRLWWIPVDTTVHSSGDCDHLPTISLEPFEIPSSP